MSSFLRQVAQNLLQRFGKNLGEIAIVFNNQRPARYLKQELALQLGETFWSPQFFTIQDFVRRSTTRSELPFAQQLLLLHQVYSDVQRAGKSSYEDSLDQFFHVGEMMLSDFAQLDYELAPVDLVFQDLSERTELDQQFDFLTQEQREFLGKFWAAFAGSASGSSVQKKFLALWRLMPQLYRAFKEALALQEAHTISGMYRDLAEAKAGAQDPAEAFSTVVFVGFNALNACEVRLFKRWQDEGKALFYFDADPYYVDDLRMEAGFFVRQNVGTHGLRNALGDFQPQIHDPARARPRQLRYLAAPGHQAQAQVLAEILEQEYKSASSSPNLAVILADETLLIPVLQSLPSSLEVNVTMGYPIRGSMTYNFLELFFEMQLALHAGKLPLELLFDLVSHPFSAFTDKKRAELLGVNSIADLNLLAKDSALSNMLMKTTGVKMFFEQLEAVLQERLEVYAPELLLGRIELKLMEQALQSIRQFRRGLQDAAPIAELSIPILVNLLRRLLGKLSASLPGDPLSGVQIMGLLESRNLHFERIFLLGANEGILPAPHAAPTFIPYTIRRAYRLPVLENQQALTAYLFYRLLHHIERMDLIYNANIQSGIGGGNGEITRFALQLEFESQLDIQRVRVDLTALAPREPTLDRRPEASVSNTWMVPKEGRVWELLQSYLHDTADQPRRQLSASAFTLYLNSPLEFFLKYILHLKEPPVAETEIRANELGSVIHLVMERLYRPFMERGQPVRPEDIQAFLQGRFLENACRTALLDTKRTNKNTYVSEIASMASSGFSSQDRIILGLSETYCRRYLQHDQQLGLPIQLIEIENDEDYSLVFPLRVGGENGMPAQVRLRGIIDRVDRVGGLTRIVDYKTGGDLLEVKGAERDETGNVRVPFFQNNWKDSNKAFIQTLFYTHIFEKCSGHQGVVPHLYSVRKMRTEGTQFFLKQYRKSSIPVEGLVLEQVKADFERFLRHKLEELFDPNTPFVHHPTATVYEGNYLREFLNPAVEFSDDESNEQ